MLAVLQIIALAAISFLFASSVCASWLGISPEGSFLDFIRQTGILLPLIGLLTIYGSSLAFILGWRPNVALANWFRMRVIVPAFTQPHWLLITTFIFLAAGSATSLFIFGFSATNDKDIFDAILAEDFDRADQLIVRARFSNERLDDFKLFNDSERQLYFKSTGDADQNSCRKYYAYFDKRRAIFQSAWTRYLFDLSLAACLDVLDDPKNALAQYQHALKLSRWLGPEQTRLSARRIAALYLRDNEGYSDIPDLTARLHRVLALLATDPDETAIRMRGAAQYLLGQYSKAAQEWEKALGATKAQSDIERKKLLNNLALTYTKLGQNTLALAKADAGLGLSFDATDERQRREQIRLLSTKLDILRAKGDCRGALDVFAERDELKQQDRSPCTALIEAQVRACAADRGDASPGNLEKMLDALLFGVGQNASSFVDFTKDALTALVNQGDLKFKACYIGLHFDRATVEDAVLKLRR